MPMTLWLVSAVAVISPCTDRAAPGSGTATKPGTRARVFASASDRPALPSTSVPSRSGSQPLKASGEGASGAGTIAGSASPLATCSQG